MSYRRRGKFNNKKIIIEGIVFDSKLEAKRYKELKFLEQKGLIRDLQLQKKYLLQPKYRKNNRTIREITYRADFSYFSIKDNKYIIEDVKRL